MIILKLEGRAGPAPLMNMELEALETLPPYWTCAVSELLFGPAVSQSVNSGLGCRMASVETFLQQQVETVG